MTTPRFATSRPAALTGTIGQGGFNRVHDVALVQALLGAKRDRSSRPYLRDHVTGQYDKFTTEALLRYRMDQRDTNIKRPFARSGPHLNKLSQGQALAVLEGTALPYKLATLAEPGEIQGPAAELLSATRKVALKEVMKAFIQDWGIALDVEIKAATENLPPRSKASWAFDSRPLVVHFRPRNFSVRLPRGLSVIPSNEQFRARAKALYEIVEADLKARCVTAFGITDPVDVKIQNGLKGDLACVVRTDLEGVEALTQFLLADGRKKGFTLAVRFLENYLKADADEIPLSQDEALSFPDVRNAVAVNIRRFWQNNLIAPKTLKQGVTKLEAISQDPEKNELQFTEYWEKTIPSRAWQNLFWSLLGFDVDPQSGSISFGPGGSNLKSSDVFVLKRNGNRIAVNVTITHIWSDRGFEFDPNDPFYHESQVLERHKKAKPFPWKAEWIDTMTGELEIIDPFTPNATRRIIGGDTMPPGEDISP